MSDYIPDHVLANVLLRLPFDSLIRFRCVSKSWRNLIDSPFFIEMHSRRSRLIETNPHPDSKIVALFGDLLYTFDSVVKDGRACKPISKQLSSPPLEFSERGLDLLGSCNGILCLWSNWTDDLALWNPFTGSYSALPCAPYEFTKECRCAIQAAFGYDHLNDDYKVVKWYISAVPAWHLNDLPSSRRYELCVYSLKYNSWSRIRDAIPFELPEFYCFFTADFAFANGAVHWPVTGISMNFDNFIAAFDLGSYEFRRISGSPFAANPGCTECTLGSLNGCLSLVCYSYSRTSPQVRVAHVWVMEDYGVESSWTMLMSIELPSHLQIWDFKPVAISKKRRKVLLQVSWQKLVVYDSKNKSFRDVAISEASCSASCVCVSSFVSPWG